MPENKWVNKQKYQALIFLLCFFVGFIAIFFCQYYWLRHNTLPPEWDEAWYLQNSEQFYKALVHGGISGFYNVFYQSFSTKAPLVALIPLPFYLAGFSHKLGVDLSLLSLSMVFFLVFYWFARQYLHKWDSLLAVGIVFSIPLVFGLSRLFFVEFSLAILVLLWFIFQKKSKNFSKTGYSVVLGVLFGLGMLMKVSFPLYVFPIVLIGLWRWVVTHKSEMRIKVKSFLLNLFIILVIGLSIAATWYWYNFKMIMNFGVSASFGSFATSFGLGNPFNIQTIYQYWSLVVTNGLTGYYFLLGLAVLLAILVLRKTKAYINQPGVIELFISLCVPFIVYTFAVNKDYRYLMPLIPLWVILFMLGLDQIHFLKNTLIKILILPLPVIFFLSNSFGFGLGANQINLGGFSILKVEYDEYTKKPVKENWPISKIVNYIDKDSYYYFPAEKKWTLQALIIPDYKYINYATLSYYGEWIDSRIRYDHLTTPPGSIFTQNLEEDMLATNYLITKSGDQGFGATTFLSDEINEKLKNGELPFEPIQTFTLPDSSVLTVYRNDSH
jgi:Dolichyl-phosphate-mannose-protein mannosyltransferase